MDDIVFIKDKQGSVLGFWIKNSEEVKNRQAVEYYFTTMSFPLSLLKKGYRVVPNTFDGNFEGGCFLMLGSSKAPGEK